MKGSCLAALTQIFASQKLLLCWERYVIVPKEKRKVLEEIMRSDKRINPCK